MKILARQLIRLSSRPIEESQKFIRGGEPRSTIGIGAEALMRGEMKRLQSKGDVLSSDFSDELLLWLFSPVFERERVAHMNIADLAGEVFRVIEGQWNLYLKVSPGIVIARRLQGLAPINEEQGFKRGGDPREALGIGKDLLMRRELEEIRAIGEGVGSGYFSNDMLLWLFGDLASEIRRRGEESTDREGNSYFDFDWDVLSSRVIREMNRTIREEHGIRIWSTTAVELARRLILLCGGPDIKKI
jgi:hypothetical protein